MGEKSNVTQSEIIIIKIIIIKVNSHFCWLMALFTWHGGKQTIANSNTEPVNLVFCGRFSFFFKDITLKNRCFKLALSLGWVFFIYSSIKLGDTRLKWIKFSA